MKNAMSSHIIRVPIMCSIFGLLTVPLSAGENSWALPVDGYWRENSNWTGGSAPSRFSHAVLGHSAEYTVFFDYHELIQSMSILNPDATLQLLKSAELEVSGSIENHGIIRISSSDLLSEAFLSFPNSRSLFGTGRLVLGSQDAQLRIDQDEVLTQDSDHCIEGVGSIVGDILNHGTIQPTPGQSLEIYESSIEQSATGISRASDPSSVLRVHGGSIKGGTVETTNGGMILLEDTGSLLDVQISNEFLIGVSGHSYMSGVTLDHANITLVNKKDESNLYIDNNLDFQGIGNFYIRMPDPQSYIQMAENFVLPDSYQISGYGRIFTINFTNNSTILADNPEYELYLEARNNNGLIGSINGATLVVDGTINNFEGKIVASGAGSAIRTNPFRNIFINGGTLLTEDNGIVFNEGGLYLDDTLLLCEIHSTQGSLIGISGVTYHSKQILIDNATFSATYIYGPGKLVLNGDDALLESTDFTNGPDHRIEGNGSIGDHSSQIYNGGTISANTPRKTLRLDGRTLENYSILESVNGATLLIDTLIEQSSTASIKSIGPESRVDVIGSRFISIDGGTLISDKGGVFHILDDSNFNDITINAEMILDGQAALSIDGDSAINGLVCTGSVGDQGGTVEILDTRALQGSGTIHLSTMDAASLITGGTTESPLIVGSNFLIQGEGTLTEPVICNGTLSPGSGIGTLNFQQELELTDQSVCEIEISPSASDMLQVGSSCSIAGEISVKFTNNFHPTAPWSRTALVAESIVIENTVSHSMPKSPNGLVSRIYTDDNSLLVGQSYLADITLDGVVDFFDITAFLSVFTSESFVADLNGDLSLDFFDIAMFIQSFQLHK